MNVVSKRKWYFLLSALVIVPCVISLIIPPALKAGIDFSSGSAIEMTFIEDITEHEVRTALGEIDHKESKVQQMDSRTVFIRTKELQEGELELIQAYLTGEVAEVTSVPNVDTVSPEVAGETVRNAIIAVLVAALAILLFISWAFRGIPNPLRYGVSALLALFHDILIIIGIFSILGKVIDFEVNAMLIVGLLAVAGYSVNDTIVVFDRIRENVARNIDRPLAESVNISILESMGRSLGTSCTTLFALIALYFIGGATLKEFLLVLIIGTVVGTYSSIFIAAQFLVLWEQGEVGRFFEFLRLRRRRVRSSTN